MGENLSEDLAGMGRRRQRDDRNAKFLLPVLPVSPTNRRRFWWSAEVLDQMDTPQCVGYAGYGWLRGGPVTNTPPFTPTQLYKWAQQRDEWPGENYDGTSTLGLMKALKERGYIESYHWAFDAKTVANWVLNVGPILVGTWWTIDMFMPDVTGFIEFAGEKVGGHEWRIVGVDLDEHCPDGSVGAVRMVNSWGRNWGEGGRAWVSLADLDRLLKDEGEAVTAMEIKLA